MMRSNQTERRTNTAGQRMGRKGLATRNRIIDALLQLLSTHNLRDIKPTHITRLIDAAPSRFTFYFSDIEEALLATIEAHPQASSELMLKLEADWSGPDATDGVRDFVVRYLAYWEANFDLLKARNLAADEGDQRFLAIRREHAAPLREALAQKVVRSQMQGRVPSHLHPSSVAGTILASLERMTAILRYPQSESGVSRDSLIDAAVYMIQTMIDPLTISAPAPDDRR